MTNEPSTLAEISGETDRADGLIAVLADDQARQIFQYFQGAGEYTVSVDGLVDALLDSECQPEYRDQLAVQLHHVTLPKLADVGLIEYDARSHTVRYRASPLCERVSTALTA